MLQVVNVCIPELGFEFKFRTKALHKIENPVIIWNCYQMGRLVGNLSKDGYIYSGSDSSLVIFRAESPEDRDRIVDALRYCFGDWTKPSIPSSRKIATPWREAWVCSKLVASFFQRIIELLKNDASEFSPELLRGVLDEYRRRDGWIYAATDDQFKIIKNCLNTLEIECKTNTKNNIVGFKL